MTQEIITYLIIAIAVVITVLKLMKKFRKKRSKKTSTNYKKATMQHNCSDCSAECILRDTTSPVIQNNSELCKKIETSKSD